MSDEKKEGADIIMLPADKIVRINPDPSQVHPAFKDEARRASIQKSLDDFQEYAKKVADPELLHHMKRFKQSFTWLLNRNVEQADYAAVWAMDQVDLSMKALYDTKPKPEDDK